MEEVLSDGVAESVNDRRVVDIENEFSVKPGSSNMLKSDEMLAPGGKDYLRYSKNVSLDTLDGKNLDRIGSSERASASPHCMNDSEFMVKELTLTNVDGDGTSSSKERTEIRRNQWQNLFQISGGSGTGDLRGQAGYKDKDQENSKALEDEGNNFFGLLDGNQPLLPYNLNPAENVSLNNDKSTPGDMLHAGGLRTKVLSKSGFAEYFVKSSLGAKGVTNIIPSCRTSVAEVGGHNHPKSVAAGLTHSVAPSGSNAQHASHLSHGDSETQTSIESTNFGDGISLREWLEAGQYKANKMQSLQIFVQVLEFVDISHSRGVPIQDLRPSCFKVSEACQVTYLGSSVCAGVTENVKHQYDNIQHNHVQMEKREIHQNMLPLDRHSMKKRKLVENMIFTQRWPQFPSRSGMISGSVSDNVAKIDEACLDSGKYIEDQDDNVKKESKRPRKLVDHHEQPLQPSLSCVSEERWYTSPELFNEKTVASNIYCLGVLLFELLAKFDSGRSHAAAMQNLRHRILPPSFLSENPKEAGFCLWLLHPEPSLRPTTREILQSEFICGTQKLTEVELLPSIDEEDGESELLLYYLSLLNEQKQKDASNLMEEIQQIESDIQEVENRRPKSSLVSSSSSHKLPIPCGENYTLGGNPSLDLLSKMSHASGTETRLMRNISQLERAYFSTRSNIQLPENVAAYSRQRDLLKFRQKRSSAEKKEDEHGNIDCLGGFFDGLCKYARYSKFEVRGVLRNGELNSSSNVMCLSFDRDEDYLAAGGVSKKIKIFEFQALFNDSVDIHYPVVEMANKSKLSCICWNSYIRNYLASTDYDGIVKLWDAATGQGICNFAEHRERAWSVDFSRVDPMKLASGSDDRLVKLWSINDKNSLSTIRSSANVCSVQFSDESSQFLAFSTADHKTFCYDLRNISTPWCILAGHKKAVSYAKFLNAGTLVTASTDNTLKIWDLNKTSTNRLSRDACVLTLGGHTNEKNFVGLSVADGYITCGSETNEVFAYHKSLPMPIASHKFGSIDPITGKESEDANGRFVTSVCWRRKSNMIAAANSSGSIKVLQMV